MTACKDSQATSGKKAVSATLAGVLAVGLVPAVALADEAVEVQTDDAITARTVGEASFYNNGTVSQVSITGEAAVATPSNIELTKDSGSTATNPVVPVQVTATTAGYDPLSVAESDGAAISSYTAITFTKKAYDDAVAAAKADNTTTLGTELAKANPAVTPMQTAGSYVVIATDAKDAAGLASAELISKPVSFKVIGGQSLNGAGLFTGVNPTATATSFTYTGSTANPKVSLDGKELTATTDYTISILSATGTSTPMTNPLDAGKYIAKLTGAGAFEGSVVEIPFEVTPLDLSKATIVLNDIQQNGALNPSSVIFSINGEAPSTALTTILTGASGQGTTFGKTSANLGPNTCTVAANPAENSKGNVTGSQTLSFNIVASTAIAAAYGNGDTEFEDGDDIVINMGAAGTEAFVPASSIKVSTGATYDVADKLDPSRYSITVTDTKTNSVVPNTTQLAAGTYDVVIRAIPNAEYDLGGVIQATVTVYDGYINAGTGIFVSYEGQVKDGFSKIYTGKDYLDGIKVEVKDTKGNVVPAEDYSVKYTNAAGVEVDEFVNAQTYKVTVSLAPANAYQDATANNAGGGTPTFDDIANVCGFTVAPVTVELSDVKVANEVPCKFGTTSGKALPYTGATIVPELLYPQVDEDGKPVMKDGEQAYATIPAASYKATYEFDAKTSELPSGALSGTAKKVQDVGFYLMTLVAGNTVNVDVKGVVPNDVNSANTNFSFAVMNVNVFDDVTTSDWFYKPVLEANEAGYMKGYNGTKLFGPNADIKRGDVACVLYNMAGGAKLDEGLETDDQGYPTPFSDVDKGMYWAKAIQWAAKAGVVHGYAGTDTFRPDANITREEFAAMLANYAKQRPGYEAPSVDAELASFPDGSAVSGWARESVAWATSADVMGNGGFLAPLSNITRAETAAMAVNYQPYEG